MASILYPVLNWGLGHASRSSELIERLGKAGHRVIPASDGDAQTYLKRRFPNLEIKSLPTLNVRYPFHSPILNMSIQAVPILRSFIEDHRAVAKLSKEVNADIVLSDHRLGGYVPGLRNIMLIHQINIPLPPLLAWPANRLTRYFLSRFDEIWIPDFPGHRLSGELSAIEDSKKRFIGPISHFKMKTPAVKGDSQWDFLVILSGPEPQRSLFEARIIRQLQKSSYRALIVQGKPGKGSEDIRTYKDGIQLIPFLPPDQLIKHIYAAGCILSRAGYSSIMDYVCLGQKALLIPTPGQPEQEYLATHLHSFPGFMFQKEDQMDIHAALQKLRGGADSKPLGEDADALLEDAISSIVHRAENEDAV